MTKTLAVIGCGTMGEAIIAGLLDAGKLTADQIMATHPRADRRAQLAERLGIEVVASNAEATQAEILLLGVKPQVIQQALRDIAHKVQHGSTVVSIAAGITLQDIESYAPEAAVIRCMPNLPVVVRQGVLALAPGTQVSEAQLHRVQDLLEALGHVEILDEYHMDAVTGLSGTGPMYIAHILEALADGGVAEGLPRGVANRLALHTVQGSVAWAAHMDIHPARLKDQVASPAGTTMAALRVLRREAFQSILMDAVAAATERSRSFSN